MKRTTRLLSYLMAAVIITGLFATTSFAANQLTTSEIREIEKAFDEHGYVLKQGFWANSTTTGKKAITSIQKLYCAIGHKVSIDGGFGPEMKSNTIAIQKELGLVQDGIVGRKTFNAIIQEVKTKSVTTSISASNMGYLPSKSVAFAEKYATTNKNWLCAEYVSRSLIAGNINIKIRAGCGDLFRDLEKMSNVTKYLLKVESNGKILPKNNPGKISSGDVIIMYCKNCKKIDGKPYVHAVLVGDTSSSGIKVYAHNKSYSNETYWGFNSCGYCSNEKPSDVIAYGFHFKQ